MFIPSARRLQKLYQDDQICLYEDFAHHPTAIASTLDAVRKSHRDARIVAIVEPRSNTMQMAHHSETIGPALGSADNVIIYMPHNVDWGPNALSGVKNLRIIEQAGNIIDEVSAIVQDSTVIVAMSNGSFDGIPDKLRNWLSTRQ
jgi:UDP-N-acetylmuramate: L-alanyl-gamma-D-glutamyl-meso-diaminopimelate ligase